MTKARGPVCEDGTWARSQERTTWGGSLRALEQGIPIPGASMLGFAFRLCPQIIGRLSLLNR